MAPQSLGFACDSYEGSYFEMRTTLIRNFATPRIFELETWNWDHWKSYIRIEVMRI